MEVDKLDVSGQKRKREEKQNNNNKNNNQQKKKQSPSKKRKTNNNGNKKPQQQKKTGLVPAPDSSNTTTVSTPRSKKPHLALSGNTTPDSVVLKNVAVQHLILYALADPASTFAPHPLEIHNRTKINNVVLVIVRGLTPLLLNNEIKVYTHNNKAKGTNLPTSHPHLKSFLLSSSHPISPPMGFQAPANKTKIYETPLALLDCVDPSVPANKKGKGKFNKQKPIPKPKAVEPEAPFTATAESWEEFQKNQSKKKDNPFAKLVLSSTDLETQGYPNASAPTSSSFKKTSTLTAAPKNASPFNIIAVDCEMCVTTSGEKELVRISLVDSNLNAIYDSFVKPENPIKDYLTSFSGITSKTLEKVTKTLEQVHKEILGTFINKDTILVGHSLEFDLNAMKIIHNKIIDTSVLYPHFSGAPYKYGLKFLAKKYLRRNIQAKKNAKEVPNKEENEEGHDPREDAKAAMELVIRRVLNLDAELDKKDAEDKAAGKFASADELKQWSNKGPGNMQGRMHLFDRLEGKGQVECFIVDRKLNLLKYASQHVKQEERVKLVLTDEEMTDQLISLLKSRAGNQKKAFVFAQLHEVETKKDNKEELNQELEKADKRLEKIWNSCENGTLMVVIGDKSNTTMVEKMIREQKKQESSDEQGSFSKELVVGIARRGMVWAGIKGQNKAGEEDVEEEKEEKEEKVEAQEVSKDEEAEVEEVEKDEMKEDKKKVVNQGGNKKGAKKRNSKSK